MKSFHRTSSAPRYMLRRTLSPWKFDACIAEAADFCSRFGIDEVIWKIDTEEFSHGLPTHDLIRKYLQPLSKSREALARIGTIMSINPWVTIGMRDAGWDNRQAFPDMDWLTDITGVTARSQGCPLSPAWREWFFGAFEMYASTHPAILWIEDDIRVIRHRPVWYACYCDRHLAEFSKLSGHTWTREALAAEILKPGVPSPVRAQWLAFEGSVIAEVFEILARRVEAVDPEVRLGLMCSRPSMHASEIRDWDRCLKGLRGRHKSVPIRPTMGVNSGCPTSDFYNVPQLVSGTFRCARVPVQGCVEVENWPFTQYGQSPRINRAQTLLAAALGCESMTYNMYDHMGTPLMEEPQFGQMLKDARPLVDAIVEAYSGRGTQRGVRLLHHERAATFTRLKSGATFADLLVPDFEPWARTLEELGLTITFDESPVVAVSGNKLRCFADKLDEIFSGGVLLDLSALETLIELGRGDLAGVKLLNVFRRKERQTAAEEITDAAFGLKADCNYMTVDIAGIETRIGEIELMPGARAISRMVNPDRMPLYPACVIFENALGGRVAVLPYDLTDGDKSWLLSWHRKRQFTALVDWLFGGRLPLTVGGGAHPLAIRTDFAGRVMVSVFNASLDRWPSVEMTLSLRRRPRVVWRLDARGKWTRIAAKDFTWAASKLAIASRKPLEALDLATFRIA